MEDTVSVVVEGVEYSASYEVFGDTLVVTLPDGSQRETELRGINIEQCCRTHLNSYIKSEKEKGGEQKANIPISVFIDNNVWNLLFEHKIDISQELPRPDFGLSITREATFEIEPLRTKKPELYDFIMNSIDSSQIEEDCFFGFYDETLPPEKQRNGGFGCGRFISQEESDYLVSLNENINRNSVRKATGLFKNEADVSVTIRSIHSIVLTLDVKPGPLRKAMDCGMKVISLEQFDPSGESLKEYIMRELPQ
ncbi:TPA: hypothetical protein ACSP0C_003292 [Aeromonas veronii]